VAASKMYGKAVFFLASEAAAQEAVEKGLAVGGVFVPLEPLEDLGVRVVLTSVPPFLPNAALLPALSTLGKPINILSPLSLGCKDPTLRHILSFRRQVHLQLPPAARGGEALEGSFLVPYQGAHYRVHYSTGRPGATSAGRWGTSGGTVPWPGKKEHPRPRAPAGCRPRPPAPLTARRPEPPLLLPSPPLLPL
ncbi:hypothetical protein G0U57_015883, partial [Chelydra serpentina]